ncbi:MAG TPA: HD-GYP domain-containing protein [Patescibacteria group bacterium]|nr:HD-GYP domain-containing protein [Patescibacteria group bacterium]
MASAVPLSLHHRLALRLALGAVVVALLGGLATFGFEMERVDDAIVALASQEAKAFEYHWPGPLVGTDKERLRTRLSAFLRDRQAESNQGHFLMAEVYGPNRDQIAEVSSGLPATVEPLLEEGTHRFPKDAAPWYRKIIVDERVYVQVVTPLFGSDGLRRGYFEGVYHVPQEQMVEIRKRVTSAVAVVVAAVLLTALVLYPLILGLHREQIELSRGLLQANLDTLAVLGSAIAKRDSDTHAHNYRVALYSVGLAEAVGLADDRIRELIKGAWLHDVGKIAISDTILLKPGKLDVAEFDIMKTHVTHGVDIVRHSDWLTGAAEVVAGHHEKWDGSGYPAHLAGEDIPLNARLFALADVFDALTSRRPYKEPFSCAKALDMMAESRGSHFDPTLFDLFARIAPAMHAEFGGREDDIARDLVVQRSRHYFFQDA